MSKDIDKLLDTKHDKDEEERNADRWEPEPGDTISGVITKVGWYDGGEYEPSMYLIFRDIEANKSVRIWVKTVLSRALNEEAPAIGQHVAIRYDGREVGQSGRKYHNYTLVLVPDKDDKVKRDYRFWLANGIFTGTTKVETRAEAANAEDERFF